MNCEVLYEIIHIQTFTLKLELHTIPADAEIGNADYLANQQRGIYDSR